jgi:hypothetical protein
MNPKANLVSLLDQMKQARDKAKEKMSASLKRFNELEKDRKLRR